MKYLKWLGFALIWVFGVQMIYAISSPTPKVPTDPVKRSAYDAVQSLQVN